MPVLKAWAGTFRITGCEAAINKGSFFAGVTADFCNWLKSIGLKVIMAAANTFFNLSFKSFFTTFSNINKDKNLKIKFKEKAKFEFFFKNFLFFS